MTDDLARPAAPPAPDATRAPTTLAGDSDLPADPALYDAPRNILARRKGLETPYIPGGEDPQLADTLRRESRDARLLVGMAVGIVLLGFVLGLIGAVLGLGGISNGDGDVLARWILA